MSSILSFIINSFWLYNILKTVLWRFIMTALEKIDKLRVQRGWSIYKLAEEAMLTQSTINNLYSRKAEPKLSTLRAICDAFEITLSEFFAEDDVDEGDVDKKLQKKISRLSPQQKKALLDFLKTV